jgi:hypothetical protein
VESGYCRRGFRFQKEGQQREAEGLQEAGVRELHQESRSRGWEQERQVGVGGIYQGTVSVGKRPRQLQRAGEEPAKTCCRTGRVTMAMTVKAMDMKSKRGGGGGRGEID